MSINIIVAIAGICLIDTCYIFVIYIVYYTTDSQKVPYKTNVNPASWQGRAGDCSLLMCAVM
jgi:arginyl-tRNA--protein-N-Asp/Glu arginylyltransferase